MCDGVTHVTRVFKDRAIGAYNQALFIAKASFKLTIENRCAGHVLVGTAVLTAQPHHLAEIPCPVAHRAFAFNHIRAFHAAQTDRAARTHRSGIHGQAVGHSQGGVCFGVDRHWHDSMVEQVNPRRDEMFVPVVILVLACQQVNHTRTLHDGTTVDGDSVFHICSGLRIPLCRCGEAIGLGHRIGFQINVGQRIDIRISIRGDCAALTHFGIRIGGGLDLGLDQSDRNGTAHVHLGPRGTMHFVVGTHFQHVFQRHGRVAANAGCRIPIEAGENICTCTADHTTTTALSILSLQVRTGQVVGGQHPQAVCRELAVVQHIRIGRTIDQSFGHGSRRAQSRRRSRRTVHVVTHLPSCIDGDQPPHCEAIGCAQICGHVLGMCHPRISTRPCQHTT